MAAFELPTDLIRQAQIALRNNAGLSSFDPSDPTLQTLPSVEASIAGLDPSPAYLRCKNCKGKLLRGVQSLICIYCGKYQKTKQLPPEPIEFKSTFGYKWLLESLNLNGSEMVEPPAEGSDFSRRRRTPKDNISLSELLDLKITWPDEPDQSGTTSEAKTSEHSKSSWNTMTVNLDNFFSGPKRDVVASEEQPIRSTNIDSMESTTFVRQDDLSLFQNELPSETVITSSFNESAEISSGWDAEFQSADSRIQHENSKSGDPFVVSSGDLSAHIDSVFGHMEDVKDRKPNNDSVLPSTVNWIQDDLFTNINSSVPKQTELVDSVVKSKDRIPSTTQMNASSESFDVDWFQDATWQGNNSSNTNINKDDGPVHVGSSIDTIPPSPANDWIQQEHNISFPVPQQTVQFDFTVATTSGMSADNLNKPSVENADWFEDNQWQINAANNNNVTTNEDDESFDDWNDFTGSTGDLNSSQHSWKQGINEIADGSDKVLELSSFAQTNNFQDVNFSNFSNSDFISGASNNYIENGTHGVNNSMSDASIRDRGADAEVGSSIEQPEKDVQPEKDDVSAPTKHPKNDAEMLMSQMHDLSFMLESTLSIPSKPDDFGSFPQD